MIGKLKTLFEQIGAKDKNESITSPISKNLITAALMIEVMQADFSLDEREFTETCWNARLVVWKVFLILLSPKQT